MIGRDLKSLYIPPRRAARRRPCSSSRACAPPPIPATPSASSLRSGEILGLAGLVGSGRTELARAIFGIDRRLGGAIRLDGEPVAIALAARRHRPRHLSGAGGPQALRPGARRLDRREHLAARPASLRPRPADRRGAGGRQCRASSARALGHPDAVGRRPSSARCRAATSRRSCSAKWLSMRPQRDDLRRADARHRRRRQERDLRADARRSPTPASPILMISSDMEEVIGVSDRIAVMHEGAIAGFLDAGAVQRASNVLRLAVGNATAARSETGRMLKKDLGLLVLILVVGAVVGAHQPALPVADQPRQHGQPDRPVRPVLASARASSSSPAASSCRSARCSRCSASIFIDLLVDLRACPGRWP